MNVVFKNVSKSYGVINAIKNIDLTVESGDFIFLVGSSGAGKSTILKLILHQIIPTTGEVIIGDQNLATCSKPAIDNIRRQIGVIFQDFQLIPDKTVDENIALALDINGVPPIKIGGIIEKVLQQVNLSTRRHLFPAQLSGGEMQRASLARALAVDPKIILADEPTGNLDPENSWNLIKLIKDINEQNHTTIIMTTHNTDIIQSLNKRIVTLSNGEILSDTQTKPLLEKKVQHKHSSKT